MADFSMQFDLDNADFTNDEGEVSEVAVAMAIEKIASKIREGQSSGVVMDNNGNRVGTFNAFGVDW